MGSAVVLNYVFVLTCNSVGCLIDVLVAVVAAVVFVATVACFSIPSVGAVPAFLADLLELRTSDLPREMRVSDWHAD